MSQYAEVNTTAPEQGPQRKPSSSRIAPLPNSCTVAVDATIVDGDVELANAGQSSAVAKAVAEVEETGEPKDAGKKSTDILSWLGFNFEETVEEGYEVPKKSYLELFIIFLWFGCRAFGGPVAQIALMKQELVTDGKWVSVARFNKVYAVYQILPGPEATELACYFGYLMHGRIGAVIGGLGFLLPGFLGMLLWSYLYVNFGVDSRPVQRSFRAVQNCVAALIFRGTYKLADGALKAPGTQNFSWQRGFLFLFSFLTSAIKLNFFISLGVCGIMNWLFEHPSLPYWKDYVAYFVAACTIGFYVLYCQYEGIPSGSLIGGDGGLSQDGNPTSNGSLFVLGLIAGLVTFGGAYTTLPFIYSSAVTSGGWLTSGEFLDALAITNMMPTPLVTFVTMVGWIGNGIEGSILMTIGIFLPAFSFTIIGHKFFEAVVDNKFIEPFLEGVSSAVIGLLLLTAFQFVKGVITDGVDAVVFFLSFCAVFHFTDRYTQPITILVAAIAGQVLY